MYYSPDRLAHDSTEYNNLKICCKILEDLTSDMTFTIKEILLRDKPWTNIVATNNRKQTTFNVFVGDDWVDIINTENSRDLQDKCKKIIANSLTLWNLK